MKFPKDKLRLKVIIGQNSMWDKNYGGVFYNDYWVLQDLFSDNANSQQANIQYTSVDNMQIDQYNEPVELLWRDFYQTIKCCNVVIDKVPAIDMDDILKKHLIAEAKFFRGMMYFDFFSFICPVQTKYPSCLYVPGFPTAVIWRVFVTS